MCSPDMPEPPDPMETAAAQTGSNVSTATANAALQNINQITPYGNLTYNQSGNQFISDTNGQTYWRGPNGEIRSTRPTVAGSPAPASGNQSLAGWTQVTDANGKVYYQGPDGKIGIPPGGVPGSTAAPKYDSQWTEVKGYYVPTYTATTSLSPDQQKILDLKEQSQIGLGNLANSQISRLQSLLSTPFNLNGLPQGGKAGDLYNQKYTQYGAGPSLMTSFGSAGNIAKTFGNAGNVAGTFGNAGNIARTYGDTSGTLEARQRVEDALFTRLNPQMERDRQALETSLANKGIAVGSTAYNNAMDDYNRGVAEQRTDITIKGLAEQQGQDAMARERAMFGNDAQQQAYNQLLGRAQFGNEAQQQRYSQLLGRAQFGNLAQQQLYDQLKGRADFSNLNKQQMADNTYRQISGNNLLEDQRFNSSLSRFNAANQTRSNALNERFALRNQPISEISSLLSGVAPTNPNFVNTPLQSMPNVDVAGLINTNYQQRLANAQNAQAQSNGVIGGIGSLFGSLLGLSDERMKDNIIEVGESPMGDPVYSFTYKGSNTPQMGLMAQDVERRDPGAVIEIGGLKHVNYPRALGLMEGFA